MTDTRREDVARVRDHLAHADTLPHGLAIALVSELADEVDRLRGERDRWKARSVTAGADLDAARAALGRVRTLTAEWHVAQAANQAALARGERLLGLRLLTPRNIPLPDDYDRALEGES